MPQGSSAVRPTNGLYLYLYPMIKANFTLSITTADPGGRAVLDVGLLPVQQ